MNISFDDFADGNVREKLGAGAHSVRLDSLRIVGEPARPRLTVVSEDNYEWTAWDKQSLQKLARAMDISVQALSKSFKKDGTPTAGRLGYFEITLVERTAKNGTVYVNIT